MRRSAPLSLAIAFALSLAVVRTLVACVDLDSLGNGQRDASTDSTPEVDAAPSIPDPCVHATLVEPPATDDAPEVKLPPFELAVDSINLGAYGFDLDGVCSCDTRPGAKNGGAKTCATPKIEGADRNASCDIDGGVDNNMIQVGTGANVSEDLVNRVNTVIGAGARTILLRIEDYNGLANDSQVVVGIFPAEGIRSNACGDASAPVDGGETWTPGRCGSDTWALKRGSGVGDSPSVVDVKAYVNDYRLVAKLPKAVALPFTYDNSVDFYQPVVTGTLVPLDATLAPRDKSKPPSPPEARLYRLDGALSGRFEVGSLLNLLGSYFSGTLNARICTVPDLLDSVRASVCQSLDIQTDPNKTDPNEACNALSGSIGIVAIPALRGPYVDPRPASTECRDIDASLRCP